MLVIGFNANNNYHFAAKLDVDPNQDSPKAIHDALKKEAGKKMKGDFFTKVVCFDDDGGEDASFEDGEDYDTTEEDEDENDVDVDNDSDDDDDDDDFLLDDEDEDEDDDD